MNEMSNLEYELALKASWYYYIEDFTQQQIAETMGISRMRVVKLLEQSRKNGIIQFQFHAEDLHRCELSQQLMQRWELQDVLIVPVDDNVEDVDLSLGKAAAMYMADQIHEDTYINWGHGRTLNFTLSNLLQRCDHQLSIISLTGGVDYYLPISGSAHSNVRMHVIPAPLILSSKEAANSIRSERSVQDIFSMIWHSSTTVIGIGSMSLEATLIKKGILSSNDFLLLSMQGAIGDILSQFINEKGEQIQSSFDDRMVAISLDELKKLDNVIGVAGGINKTAAIHAALEGGYLNRLIIDAKTAEAVLQLDK